MQKNKLPDKFISSFNDIFSKIYTVTIPNEPNSLSSNMLKTIGKSFGNKIESASSVKESLIKVSNNKKKTIVIFGSLYLVGDVLSKN